MATIKKCDFCGEEIKESKEEVAVFVENLGDDAWCLDKDACSSCGEVIRRLLQKGIDRLRKALEAASDK